MPNLDPKPEPFIRGQPAPGAKSLNEIVSAVLRQIRGGKGTNSSYFGDRTFLESHQSTPQLPDVRNFATLFVVLQVLPDYLICTPFFLPVTDDSREYDYQEYNKDLGVGETPQLAVAKPYQLQQTPWEGKTVLLNGTFVHFSYTGTDQRTASTGEYSESQVVVPDYFTGDVILALPFPQGYTDPINGLSITWMDVNTAARAWAQGVY